MDANLEIAAANTWYKSALLDVEFSCHILNIDGYGELETLLKTIAARPSRHADCLNTWKTCLEGHEKSISAKELRKLSVDVYIRYDCHSKEDREQGQKKCSLEASLTQNVIDIWDFKHQSLNDLKAYLQMFN